MRLRGFWRDLVVLLPPTDRILDEIVEKDPGNGCYDDGFEVQGFLYGRS
jgi:hypothetical protein